jgi:hypothetical protein
MMYTVQYILSFSSLIYICAGAGIGFSDLGLLRLQI